MADNPNNIEKSLSALLIFKRKKLVDNCIPCALCQTIECSLTGMSGIDGQSDCQTLSDTGEIMPYKDTIGNLEDIPNEIISMILKNLTIVELSVVSTLNKWLRDFIMSYFIESKRGLSSLLGPHSLAIDAKTDAERQTRLKVFSDLGLLLKRVTCVYPTDKRLRILEEVFTKLDGFPKVTINPLENQTMKLVFDSYGRVIHQLVAGWDDCELEKVFKRFQCITKMDGYLRRVFDDKPGGRPSIEFYVRSYYRMFYDPNSDNSSMSDNRSFWVNKMVEKLSSSQTARLLMIVFGPLISSTPKPTTVPYIGYWDLTDTFFIETGLYQLGYALFLLYKSAQSDNSVRTTEDVISLFDAIIALPTDWLSENVASLLYNSGDETLEFSYDYLFAKIQSGDYAGAAQNIVFLTLIHYKLDKKRRTEDVYFLVKKLATDEHKDSLFQSIAIAFTDAVVDIENAFELEDEREVTEVHDLIEANNDLLKNFMLRPKPSLSQQSLSSQDSKDSDNCSYNSNGDSEE